MKIIDQTPFYKENGELNFLDRTRALLQFGSGWLKEIEAQKSIIAVLDKVLDRNYTLLRNVTPPALGARIPLILVGPTGVYVMYVTSLVGLFRAKGDQWGTISGNAFKPGKPNLLTRTERMARAVQVFLRRQGFSEVFHVEAALLSTDPSFSVDSLRPIIRVVMRDALEYFAASITQVRVVFTPETVRELVARILNPQTPVPLEPEEAAAIPVAPTAAAAQTTPQEEPYVPPFAMPWKEPAPAEEPPAPPSWFTQPAATPSAETPPAPLPQQRKRGLTGKQRLLLIGMDVIWCLLAAAIAFLIIKDLYL
jgi:hypothetical protein